MFKFLKDESGATAIEYGLIASAIGLAVIGTAGPLGDAIAALFADIESQL